MDAWIETKQRDGTKLYTDEHACYCNKIGLKVQEEGHNLINELQVKKKTSILLSFNCNGCKRELIFPIEITPKKTRSNKFNRKLFEFNLVKNTRDILIEFKKDAPAFITFSLTYSDKIDVIFLVSDLQLGAFK